MLLIGYLPHQIVLLTPFQEQKLLLIDILHARCSQISMPFPCAVLTTNEIQGMTYEFVLVSLVCKEQKGFVGDYRLAGSVLLSATKGLYVFGSVDLFENDQCWGMLVSARMENNLALVFGKEPPKNDADVESHLVKDAAEMGVIVAHMLWR